MADGAHGKRDLVDLDAERGVLGAVLIDGAALTTARAVLTAGDFFAPRHGVVWEAMVALAEKGSPIDVVTLCAELRDRERLNTIGGAQYVGELTDFIPTIAHTESHARIVADLAQRRRTVDAAQRIALYALEHGGDELAAFSSKALREAAPRVSQQVKTAESVAEALYARITARVSSPSDEPIIVGAPTGLPSLDEKLTLGDGRLYLIAARPAMGKSALTGQIAHELASLARGKVIFFAEEMPALEVAHRDVAGRAGVDVRTAEQGRPIQSEVESYVQELNSLNARDIVYDDTPGVSIEHIEAVCQRYAAEGPVAMVVVDYIQLMALPRAERHDIATGEISKRLKGLSKSLGCPVIAVSQLNRECESRPDKRPLLSDLRDSGRLEQDADGVVFIYRDEVYHRDSKDKGWAEVIIAKQRNGPTGAVRLRWRAELVRFEDPANDGVYDVGGFTTGRAS